jgi:hypothetical protein
VTEVGLQKRQQVCRLCSPTGFVYFKKQNRELQYANSARASRFKDPVRSLYLDDRALSPEIMKACDASAGLRWVNLESPVSEDKIIIIKKSRYPVKTANHMGQANKCIMYN